MHCITSAKTECAEEACVSQVLAAVAATPDLRREHARIAERWRALAAAYDQAQRVSGYIEWAAKRLRD